jgi:hypothetical protein
MGTGFLTFPGGIIECLPMKFTSSFCIRYPMLDIYNNLRLKGNPG